jgi:7,8-dihydroneopterin 2',3'-cyclic phosphate phosphodiesterase
MAEKPTTVAFHLITSMTEKLFGCVPLEKELSKLIKMIKDPVLRSKTREFLENPRFKVKEIKGKVGIAFKESPASTTHHHAYERGLVQHTVAVTKLALSLCDIIEDVYGGKLNRDVVIAGSLLHDIMKAPVYDVREYGGYRLSSLGERLDHLTLTIAELYRRKFPLEVIHVVAAHHGTHGPISPKTLEALIVHWADYADSQINFEMLDAARFLIKDATGEDVRNITSEKAFEIVYAKAKRGREGVRQAWRKLKQK